MDADKGMLLKQNPQEVQLYTALKTAAAHVPDWPKTLIVPVLCTVGMQSSGKTTFIEALVRFRIGPTCTGTGTRCPVRYILRDGEQYFSAGGQKLQSREDIQKAVEAHMDGLASRPLEQNGFSNEELKVEITSPGLPDLDITDLPGLKTKGAGAEEIKAIVRGYVQSKSARPVVLVKATENVETQADVEVLRAVGIEPEKKNAVFIVNYFNDQLYKFSRISELNEYCKGYVQNYHHVFFCMLIYCQEAKDKKDKLDFEGQRDYYRQLPEKEAEAFEQRVALCTKDEDVHGKHVTSNFGIAHAVRKMQSIIQEFVNEEGRKYADRVAPLKEKYESRIRKIEKELNECNSEYIKEQREKYVETFGLTLRCIQRCKTRVDLPLPPFNPMDCSQTFSEEVARVQELVGETFLGDCRRLPSHFLADSKLTSDASLWRLCDIFDYVVSTQITIKPVKENEACCISGYAPGDQSGAFDKLQVVKEVATRPLLEVASKLTLLLRHVIAIYEKDLTFADGLLKSHPGYTATLSKHVSASYASKLKKLVDESEEDFKNIVSELSSFMLASPETRRCPAPEPTLSKSKREVSILLKTKVLPAFGATLKTWAMRICGVDCMSSNWETAASTEIKDGEPVQVYHAKSVYCKRVREKDIEDDMLVVNDEAARLCEQRKKELLTQIKNKVSYKIFRYLNDPIIRDMRDQLAQQIRNVDAKQIDEDTKAKASEMRIELEEAHQQLVYIDKVLDTIRAMREQPWSRTNNDH